jgi:uncharacterized protein
MRKLVTGCAILAAIAVVLAQSPALQVSAQEKPASPTPKVHTTAPTSGTDTSRNVDPSKEANIRQLMEVTGAKGLGEQLMKAGMEQFRASVTESQPDNPRAKQFVDAFVMRFQKHFDPNALNDKVVPIYDKYLTDEDVKGLLQYYSSPLGQRMLKALPEVAREAQVTGVALGQKAAQETLEDLKTDYPEFVSAMKAEEKVPDRKQD